MTKNICSKTDVTGWTYLLLLISCFIFAYAVFFARHHAKTYCFSLRNGRFSYNFWRHTFVVLVIKWSNDSILELHTVAEREKRNAVHDALTGLPNRKYCFESIEDMTQPEGQ